MKRTITRERFQELPLPHTPAGSLMNADRFIIFFPFNLSQSPHDNEANDLRLTLIPLVDTSIGAFGV